jgi:FtsP/CotA-like multicopper oxidase with cupredoxin domain
MPDSIVHFPDADIVSNTARISTMAQPESGPVLENPRTRRDFIRSASLYAVGLMPPKADLFRSNSQSVAEMRSADPQTGVPANTGSNPAYKIEIAEVEWELSPKKKIRTPAYNGRVPGAVLRVTEGKAVTIEIANKLNHPEIVHWHGQWIPSDVDGAMEEGTPMIAPGGQTRITFTPKPSGLHWYHTHSAANRDLKRGLYTGQFGVLFVESRTNPGGYDQEQFLVLHDWEPFFAASDDGSEVVQYVASSINGRMLGYDAPIQVREGQRVLFHILNASPTVAHWLALPGHQFQVIALDGRQVATQAKVETLRLGPAERISAMVEMDRPGVWILGEVDASYRNAGMGTVIEYGSRSEKPQWAAPVAQRWSYAAFGDAAPATRKPDATIPLVFTSRFQGHGALDRWMINGKSFPETETIHLKEGLRHRLVFDNRSMDDHPVHLHRHAFELVSVNGKAMSGVQKDVVIVEAKTRVEVDLLAVNPGKTLFHCHQQDHMDSGFMTLFDYA